MSKGGTERQPPLPSSVNPGPAGSEHRGDYPKKRGTDIFFQKIKGSPGGVSKVSD